MSIQDLKQVSVVGMGLLGASITLAVGGCFPHIRVVGYSHRASTRRRSRELGVASAIVDDLQEAASGSDLVILATPIRTFEGIFREIAKVLADGCIVTDVGSTKVLPHRWAAKILPKHVHYVGSHPIAGSEKRGVDFARDDLFMGAKCILTTRPSTHKPAIQLLDEFWSTLGSMVIPMTPAQHDRIFGRVSHLPHVLAAALVNASDPEQMKFGGKGFIDTSRVASGPANVWTDILMSNSGNTARGISAVIRQLERLQKAIEKEDEKKIFDLLDTARKKRQKLIDYKVKHKELI